MAGDDVVLRSRHVLRALLCFPPPQGLIVVCALWLGWTLLLLRHLGECRDRVVLHGGGGGGGGDVMAFLGLLCLPWMLHLSGKLFKLLYQALIVEAECFHFVRVGLHCFYCPRRSTVRVTWWILHPWRISVAPACVPS